MNLTEFLSDKDWLVDMCGKIKPDEFNMPLAISIGGNIYKINDISNDKIFKDTSITSTNFKVIYGSIYNMFRNASFPLNKINQYHIISKHDTFDEKTMVSTVYFFIISDYIDDSDNPFDDQINEYYDMLFEYTSECAKRNRQKLLSSYYDNL